MSILKKDPSVHPFDEISTVDQQSTEQTVLLDAIRNKFANNENYSGNSPPIFSIPNLKIPQTTAAESPSKLNQFILGQLAVNQSATKSGAFAIPNLQIPTKLNGTNGTLADKLNLKASTSEITITTLNNGIRDLRVCDDGQTNVIDLTTALNGKSSLPLTPSKQLKAPAPNPIDFQIPFIECDIRENSLRLKPNDEYCEMDVKSFVCDSFIAPPSRFGKITCLRYRLPKRKLRVDHSFKAKHEVSSFGFHTKSPDDVILAALSRYKRV